MPLLFDAPTPTAMSQLYHRCGVNRTELRVMPEPVDTDFFDPQRYNSLVLPIGRRVFGPSRGPAEEAAEAAWEAERAAAAAAARVARGGDLYTRDFVQQLEREAWEGAAATARRVLAQQQGPGGGAAAAAAGAEAEPPAFVFLSIFKWEERKAWSVLLRAYLEEFSAAERVLLLLLTKPFHQEGADFKQEMRAWAQGNLTGLPRSSGGGVVDWHALPWVYVQVRRRRGPACLLGCWHSVHARSELGDLCAQEEHIAQQELPRLYKSADAFVLPSRWAVFCSGRMWGAMAQLLLCVPQGAVVIR